jgi:hypothetical protein
MFTTPGYSNWIGGIEPNSTDKDYAALDFEGSEGNWSDFNGSYRLPFIIEYDTVPEPATLSTPIDGYRKVLVIPARFQDEGYTYMGSSAPFVDEFGNVLYPDLQKESFEPVSQANLAQAMQEVKEFYHRNSDGTFHLEPVICPTVTIPYEKFTQLDNRGHPITPNGPNIFDSEGNIFGFANHPQWNSENRGDLGFFREDMQFLTISDDDSLTTVALKKAIQEGDDWNFWGPAFRGIIEVDIDPSYSEVFASPPTISFVGGNVDANGQIHPNFQVARAEAILDANDQLTSVKITDPGSYYYSIPDVYVNGTPTGGDLSANRDMTAVSWVVVSTYQGGAAGVGYVGAPGSYVVTSGGGVSASVIAHELGHNFGLEHSNTLTSLSEKSNSDEAMKYEYANPYSVMGASGIYPGEGDITVVGKVGTNANGNFGLTIGSSIGVDVVNIPEQRDS